MFLRQAEVIQKYRVSKPTLHLWVEKGKLSNYRTVGGHRRYVDTEIEGLLLVAKSSEAQKNAKKAKCKS